MINPWTLRAISICQWSPGPGWPPVSGHPKTSRNIKNVSKMDRLNLNSKVLNEDQFLPANTKRKILRCVFRCFVDGVIVGGIVFCASVPVLGFDNIVTNICLAGYSGLFTGGLTFFTEIRSNMKQLL